MEDVNTRWTNFLFYFLEFLQNSPIERFHSRGQQVCKFDGTIESVYIRKESTPTGLVRNTNIVLIGTLRSDNGDVHENVNEKQTSHPFILFRDYHKSPCCFKRREFRLELKRGGRDRVQTGIVELTPLQFPCQSKLTFILATLSRSCVGTAKKCPKSVMHVQSCFLDVLVFVTVLVS